ncbi:hypothetical protein Pelo_2788 [Pelomyxa schiedti]|nr:hypothetical protein Pelo_2788 [Pelomyxa schiedti]
MGIWWPMGRFVLAAWVLAALYLTSYTTAQSDSVSKSISKSTSISLSSSVSSSWTEPECKDNVECFSTASKCDYDSMKVNTPACNMTKRKCCPRGQWCVDELCAKSSEGMECDANKTCLPDGTGTRMTTCHKGKCRTLVNAGDDCSGDYLCFGNLVCEDGKCVGRKVGENCTAPSSDDLMFPWRSIGMSCEWGAFCNKATKLCTAFLTENATCALGAGQLPCGTDMQCDMSTRKCTKIFTKPVGSVCIAGVAQGDVLCVPGTRCLNGKCSVYNGSVVQIECKNDDQCDGANTCECDPYTGKHYCTVQRQYVCLPETAKMFACFAEHQCPSAYMSFSQKSCTRKNCLDQQNDAYACNLCNYDAPYYGDCVSQPAKIHYCDVLETWQSLAIVGGVAGTTLLAIVVIGSACLITRYRAKKKNYDQFRD